MATGDRSMNMNSELRRTGWKLIAGALGLALCASGCTYFAEQPEVYPDKFAPPPADRAWIPKSTASHEYVIPMQSRPPSSLPAPPVTKAGNRYNRPDLSSVAPATKPAITRSWPQTRAA